MKFKTTRRIELAVVLIAIIAIITLGLFNGVSAAVLEGHDDPYDVYTDGPHLRYCIDIEPEHNYTICWTKGIAIVCKLTSPDTGYIDCGKL